MQREKRLVLASRVEQIQREYGVAALPGERRWDGPIAATAREVMEQLGPGRLVLLEGASGSGKSRLMREVGELAGPGVVVASRLAVPELATVDCLPQVGLEDALELLARFGLGEVYTYLSPADRLSTGQQFRLRLAMAAARLAHRREGTLLVDEFATQLDRVSAMAVARTFARWVRGSGYAAVVATCHGDLKLALRPDVCVECDFGQFRKVA